MQHFRGLDVFVMWNYFKWLRCVFVTHVKINMEGVTASQCIIFCEAYLMHKSNNWIEDRFSFGVLSISRHQRTLPLQAIKKQTLPYMVVHWNSATWDNTAGSKARSALFFFFFFTSFVTSHCNFQPIFSTMSCHGCRIRRFCNMEFVLIFRWLDFALNKCSL